MAEDPKAKAVTESVSNYSQNVVMVKTIYRKLGTREDTKELRDMMNTQIQTVEELEGAYPGQQNGRTQPPHHCLFPAQVVFRSSSSTFRSRAPAAAGGRPPAVSAA